MHSAVTHLSFLLFFTLTIYSTSSIPSNSNSTTISTIIIDDFKYGWGQSQTVPSSYHGSSHHSSFTSTASDCNHHIRGCTRYGVYSEITSSTNTSTSDFVTLISNSTLPNYCGQLSQQTTFITNGYSTNVEYDFPFSPIDIGKDSSTVFCIDYVAQDTQSNPLGYQNVTFYIFASKGLNSCNIYTTQNITLSNQLQQAEIAFNYSPYSSSCKAYTINHIHFVLKQGLSNGKYSMKYDSINIQSLYIRSGGSCNALPSSTNC